MLIVHRLDTDIERRWTVVSGPRLGNGRHERSGFYNRDWFLLCLECRTVQIESLMYIGKIFYVLSLSLGLKIDVYVNWS